MASRSSRSKLKISDETFDYVCNTCVEENLIKEAIKYCIVCQQYCCHDCVRAHKQISGLKGHTLLDNASGPPQGQPSGSKLSAFPTEHCSIHRGKVLDMYCGDHDVVACYLCVGIDHRSCKDLHSVTNEIDKLHKKSDTDQTSTDLAASLKKEGLTSLEKAAVNTTSPKCDLYQSKLMKTIYMKLKNDTFNCDLRGSCIVDDTVLFTDWDNMKLKRVDIASLSVVDSCPLSDAPDGICRVGTQEVAVACSNIVQFVSIHDKLTLSRQLKMKHRCYGIAYNNDHLYITDGCKSLYMYDMSGNLLKTIRKFQHSNHIVFSDSGDRIFVGDDIGGLVCFDANCDLIMAIRDKYARADGLCVDGRGNVIVANYNSHKIAQFSQVGEKRGVIVSTHSPCSVCIHQTLNRMFVINSGENMVNVYQLC